MSSPQPLQQLPQQQQQLLRYGDASTADVVLRLAGSTAPPVYLHSQVLRKCDYFDARLSERWNQGGGDDSPGMDQQGRIELSVDRCKDPSSYLRCLELLYLPGKLRCAACFGDVNEALGVLEVAAELLFADCVAACMRYLEAVPWTQEAEDTIRSCISSLHLRPTPDLAARLCTLGSSPDCKPVEVMKEVLGELLTLVSNGAPPKARDITERMLEANVQSPAFCAVNEAALVKELQSNLELLKVQLAKFANFFSWNPHQVIVACSALRWLLDKLFSLQIAEIPIKLLAEEEELAQLMVSRIYQNPFTETLFGILVDMFQALRRGDVVISRAIRLQLVMTWLPVVAKLVHDADESMGKDSELQRNLEDGLSAIVATLPLVDQESVFRIWIGSCLKSRKAFPDLSEAFEAWCFKLRQAQQDKEVQEPSPSAAMEVSDPSLVVE